MNLNPGEKNLCVNRDWTKLMGRVFGSRVLLLAIKDAGK